MIIVDKALQARAEQGNPSRVTILGGGFMAQGLTNQIVNSVPGMNMVAIYSRKPQKAIHVLSYSGLENPIEAVTQIQLELIEQFVRLEENADRLRQEIRSKTQDYRSELDKQYNRIFQGIGSDLD
jgi:hypothetical protein